MADHLSAAAAAAAAEDTLVEDREDEMHPPSGGNPTRRNAHFLKPIYSEHHKHLPPLPCSLISSKPNFKKVRIQSYKLNPSEKWKIWVNTLKPRYQDIWKQAGIYEAILASTYTIPKDNNLIIGLAERWCGETNTFVFPWGEVSITLEDVICLGNYSVLGSPFSTPLADEYVAVFNCLKKAYKKCCRSSGGTVSTSVWMKYFMCGGNQLEHEAFLVMWLSKFVFVGTFDHIAVRNFHVAIHLSRGNRIALALPVLASIYRDMRQLHNSAVESVVDSRLLICHADLVCMWAWERFANLRPTPNVMERGEPRSARWNRVKIMNVKDVRAALDSGKESFVWRPYSIALNNCMLSKLHRDYEQWLVVDSDDTESFARCLRVSELVGLGCIEQYLPHRVAMQFGFDQDVPANVIRSQQSLETAWSIYSRPIRGMKLYIPPRLFESDVSSRYMFWWRGLLGVNEESPTSCIQYEKPSPLVSCRLKSDMKSLSPPGCAEERSEDYVEEDNIPIAQLMRRPRNTKISGKRFDLDNEPVINTYCGVETSMSSICRTAPVKLSAWSTSFSGKCKNSKSPAKRLEESEPEEDAVVRKPNYYTEVNTVNIKDSTTSEVSQVELKTLEAPGCPSEFVKERQEDVVDEDSLTIAQLLSRSIYKGCFGKIGCGDDELVLNADSKEAALVSGSRKCANEPMELSKQSISSPSKCKKSKSSTEKPIDLEEDEIVSKANHHEVNNNNIVLPNDDAVGKASCPEYNIVNIEEKSSDNASELPQLGLEARIWRLEKIFDLIKAEKFAASSRDI